MAEVATPTAGVPQGEQRRTPDQLRKRRRWEIGVILTIVIAVVVAGAAGSWLFLFSSGCSFIEGGASSCTSQVGFHELDEVDIGGARREQWLDTTVSFRIEGTPEQLDRVLDGSGFSGVTNSTEDPRLQINDVADLEGLSNIRTGSDRWQDENGRFYTREVLRGTLPGDGSTEVLYVFAHDE